MDVVFGFLAGGAWAVAAVFLALLVFLLPRMNRK